MLVHHYDTLHATKNESKIASKEEPYTFILKTRCQNEEKSNLFTLMSKSNTPMKKEKSQFSSHILFLNLIELLLIHQITIQHTYLINSPIFYLFELERIEYFCCKLVSLDDVNIVNERRILEEKERTNFCCCQKSERS